MAADYQLRDIFNVPIYKTSQARKLEFCRIVAQLQNLNLYVETEFTFLQINSLVMDGFLAPVTASYFLSGKFTPLQAHYLRNFMEFVELFTSCSGYHFSKIHAQWLKIGNAVPGNSFLFPLEELDSKFSDFVLPSEDLPE